MRYRYIPAALVAVMLAGCTGKKTPDDQQALMDASKQELVTALGERDRLLSLVREISASMDQIKHLENILTLTESQPNENSTQRKQIKADIAAIRRTLRLRREELAELEEKLKESSFFTEELQGTIDALRRQIDSQSAEIDSLQVMLHVANVRIDSLNIAVDSLCTTVDQVNDERDAARAASLRLENELNTCFYVAAPGAELKEHKIIETGFLRKTKLLKGDFDRGVFVISDKRNLETINLHSRKAKIHTNHPAWSYELVAGDSGQILHITDPEEFWSLTNYLVIQTD